MRPEYPATPGDRTLPIGHGSGNIPPVASASDARSCALHPAGRRFPEASWGEQGMVEPKPQPASQPALPIGRRAAPRLRLSLPAQLIAIEKAHACILLNISRTGAQVAILDAIREGEGAILRCGIINHFAIVARSEFGLNALVFDEPLTDEMVLDLRRYHENFEERQKRALIETARKWVTGDSSDGRAI